jgi:hypothetical protein
MESVVIFSVRLKYFTTIGYISWAFGNFVVFWYIFSALWYFVHKNLATRVASKAAANANFDSVWFQTLLTVMFIRELFY